MRILVGYSGYVGSNLMQQIKFDKVFNSKNISDSYDLKPDLCIYAGVKAQKFIANMQPVEDFAHILETIENIKKIKPKKLVLISTVDVLDETQNVDESHVINTINLMPYGNHRRYLEKWVIKNIEDYHIVRLPALYGENLKKNFLYDILNPIPSMLSEELFMHYSGDYSIVSESYYKKDNNFFYLKEDLNAINKDELLLAFSKQNFTSLNFTDGRAQFQFYPLSRLSQDLLDIIKNNIQCIQLVTEPLSAAEIYEYLFNSKFNNHVSNHYPRYNLKTRYSNLWNRFDGYLISKLNVLEDLKDFMGTYRIGSRNL